MQTLIYYTDEMMYIHDLYFSHIQRSKFGWGWLVYGGTLANSHG